MLCGWTFGIDRLKTVYGPITMKTNAAIALACAGASLGLHARERRRIAAAMALATALIGGVTLCEHLTGWDAGIDQLLFTEAPGAAATTSPNRMGPHAATSFLMAGTALLLLWRNTPAAVRIAQALAFTGCAFALVAATGYAYGAVELYGIARYTGIALHTAVAFLVLHGGILAMSSTRGPMAVFVEDGIAGTLLRRLAIPVIALPLVFGYLFVLGRQRQVFDRGLGAALFAVAIIAVLLTIVWRTAAAMQVSDRDRRSAHEAAERANMLKDQFIAGLSHELRTPLNVMLGRLRMLDSEPDADARVRAATVIARNGQLLARLVGDLLDLSRAAAGQVDISRTDVAINQLAQTTVDSLSGAAAARNVAIRAELSDEAGVVRVDPDRMQQVLTNVLSNAIKFASPGGTAVLRTARGDGQVTITVTDDGVGFDEEFAPHLFEPFRQADGSARREHGGLGLGLSIARHLVTLHGGTITASSDGIGRGATFTIALPADIADVEPSAPVAVSAGRRDVAFS